MTRTAKRWSAKLRENFRAHGAAVDVASLGALAGGAPTRTGKRSDGARGGGAATVAAGQTNSQIASALGISGHTVRRHLQNVFARLGVPSRAAAAAFAVQHGLN